MQAKTSRALPVSTPVHLTAARAWRRRGDAFRRVRK